jgi:tetratricopeptide (TPR) repeat protein
MAHVIRAYHPIVKLPESEAELAAIYRSVLHNQRAVLLMDNARDARQVEPLIPPQGCLFLVTSRQHFTLPGMAAYDIDVLPTDHAYSFLIGIAPRLAEESDQTVRLAELCGNLPLALRAVASALLNRPDITAADYVTRLADARERLRLTETEAVFKLSYDLIADLQYKFRVLGVFPGTFDVGAASSIWKNERGSAQDELGELLRYSLVQFNSASLHYRLHDLLRLFAQSRLDAEEESSASKRLAHHYLIVLGEANDLYHHGGKLVTAGLRLFDTEADNIKYGQSWARTHANEDEGASQLCSFYPIAGVFVLPFRQHPHQGIEWLEDAIVCARRLKDRKTEGLQLSNLGTIYSHMGNTSAALQYYEQAIAVHREVGNRRGVAADLNKIGNSYIRLGEPRRGIEYLTQAMEIHRSIGFRRGEAHVLRGLSNAYHILGDFEAATRCSEQSLQIARDIGDRHNESQCLGNLGNCYFSVGKFDLATDYYKQQLSIAREMGDRHGEGVALGNIGNTYSEAGKPELALQYLNDQLKISHDLADRRAEAYALTGLGTAYGASGQHLRAIEYYEKSLPISVETGERISEANTLLNMMFTYTNLGERNLAIKHGERALKIFEEVGSPGATRAREHLDALRRPGHEY